MAACIPKVQGFLEALRFATDEEGADIVTPRNAKVQKSAELLRGLFGGAPSPNRQKGEEIIEQIASDIRGLVRMATLSGKIDEDKLWTAFHSYRQDKDRLLGLWNQLGDIVGIELDAIVIQATTEQFLIKLLRSASVESRAPAVPSQVLSMNEKRAILYAGGYVVHTMKKKIKDDKKVTDEGCYDALEGMLGDQWDTEEGGDDDFALFVKSWISQVDRGGLTILNEAAYCFFELLELFVYDELKALKNPKARIDTKDLVDKACSDVDLRFQWDILAVDITTNADSEHILSEIVTLWLKMRGHSLASELTEQYKKATGKKTQKARALRKTLQQRDNGESVCTYICADVFSVLGNG